METKLLALYRDLKDQSETLAVLKSKKQRAVETMATIDQEIEAKTNTAAFTESKIYQLIQQLSS